MAYTTPTVSDFKSYFNRDFPYGTLLDTVQDADITKALNDAAVNINQGLFTSQTNFNNAFLNLSAHYLVLNLRAASQGIAGQFGWLQASKGVGSVSESFSIPQRILDNPELAFYCKTNYGAKYVQLVLPMLTGQIFTSFEDTKP